MSSLSFALREPRTRARRLPRSHWSKVWAAWCPTCEQEAMPLSTGCCGWCDTHLAGQPTRGPYDPRITAATADKLASHIHNPRPIATAA